MGNWLPENILVIIFVRLTNDEFVNSVFYDNKRTYRERYGIYKK